MGQMAPDLTRNSRHGQNQHEARERHHMEKGIFDGLKVLDCASFIAAPAAATVLSDFGADVIKIEPPGTGDPYRESAQPAGIPAQRAQLRVDAGGPQQAKPRARPDQAGRRRRCCIGSWPRPTSSSPTCRRRCATGSASPLSTGAAQRAPDLCVVHRLRRKGRGSQQARLRQQRLLGALRPDGSGAADENTTPARSIAGMGDHPCAMAFYGAIVTALYKRERTGKGSHVSSNLMANGIWAASVLVAGQTVSAPSSASGGRASTRSTRSPTTTSARTAAG